MCTVSWFTTKNGYELFFNRDESRIRAEALPPQVRVAQNCSVLSPIDTEAGGSWIAVNHFGITVCLLNLYTKTDQQSKADFISRGFIIKDLMCCVSIADVIKQIEKFDLTQFRTFRVLAMDAQTNTVLLVWDGNQLTQEINPVSPKSSSSLHSEQVRDTRKSLYRELGLNKSDDRSRFLAFHQGHQPNKDYSVCVHRENTKTVSLSHIVVQADMVQFNYYSGSPCQNLQPETSSIKRQSAFESFKQVHVA